MLAEWPSSFAELQLLALDPPLGREKNFEISCDSFFSRFCELLLLLARFGLLSRAIPKGSFCVWTGFLSLLFWKEHFYPSTLTRCFGFYFFLLENRVSGVQFQTAAAVVLPI